MSPKASRTPTLIVHGLIPTHKGRLNDDLLAFLKE